MNVRFHNNSPTLLVYFPYFEKNRSGFIGSPTISFWMPEPIYETWYVYYDTESIWVAYFINPFPQVVCMCITLLLLGIGLVYTFTQQQIHEQGRIVWHIVFVQPMSYQRKVCGSIYIPFYLQGNGSVSTFPWQRRIVRGGVFYAVYVVSKESRQSVFHRTSFAFWFHKMLEIPSLAEQLLASQEWLDSIWLISREWT
jgi:hypothetical protein